MWAIVKKGVIGKKFNRPKAYTDENGTQHPVSIFTAWSKEELAALDIYKVEKITTSYDSRTQRSGGESYRFDTAAGVVYLENTVTDLPVEQVKEKYIRQWNDQAFNLLKDSDWKIIREIEWANGLPAGKDIKWLRSAIRLHVNTIEAGMEACTTIQEVRDYLDILPEWPKLEDYVPLQEEDI